MKGLFIGTSGFSYSHWEKGVFYPEELKKNKKLEYYSGNFNTVELNSSFYHLPKKETFSNWKGEVPKGFIFSVKVSRYITHIKKLKDSKEPWNNLLERSKGLDSKLGPFLFQFPPNWKKNKERLEKLLKNIDGDYKIAFEFRHPSWFCPEIYEIFENYKNVSFCITDSPNWPSIDDCKGDFVYIRMHGKDKLYSSSYSEKKLKELSEKIKEYLSNNLEVYCYFNNDAKGNAVSNAKELLRILKE